MSAEPARADGAPVSIADADLVVRLQSGDRRAEDTLYRRYARPVMATVVRLLGTHQDAEDVVHDAFIMAFDKVHQLRDPAAFRGWLMRIAVIRVRRAIRTRRLQRALGLLPSADDASLSQMASTSASPEVRADLAAIDAILKRSPAEARLAWMLRYVEGYQLEEVAELCDCSLATAKRRIAAAQDPIGRSVRVVLDPEAER